MERAFDGEPCLPRPKQAEGGGRRGGGGGGGGGGRKQMQAQAPAAPQLPYDGGLGAAALWGMPGMMGAMQAPGMAPFGFPPRPGMPGMMPGMPGMGGMPMMPGMPGVGQSTGRFQGLIKSFNVQKGFGFIDCPEAHQIYGRDVFLHKAQIASFQIGSQVSFAVEINKSNMPQARDLVESDMLSMGMLGMPGVGMTGKGGYNTKGGNKGKGRGKNTNQRPGGKGDTNKKPDKKPNAGGGGSPGDSKPQGVAPELVSVPEGLGDA